MSHILLILFAISIALPQMLFAITTIHHDKPEGSRIEQMANKMKRNDKQQQQQQQYLVPSFNNITKLNNNDRQKRLLPYINYYYRTNQQEKFIDDYTTTNNGRFTPFLDSNAIPGPFVPIIKTNNYDNDDDVDQRNNKPILRQQQQQPIPNYSAIYDKLAQLKFLQQRNRYIPSIQKNHNYVPIYNYGNQRYKILPPLPPPPPPVTTTTTQSPLIKTILQTYRPTQIDLTSNTNNYQQQQQQQQHYKDNNLIYDLYQQVDNKIKEPIILIENKPKLKPQVVVEDSYVAQKYVPIAIPPQQQQQQQYEEIYYQTTPTPIIHPTTIDDNNRNTLSLILKQLQDSNALPHTLTPDNIDNSIKTLVKILNNFKKQPTQQLSKPIVVADHHQNNDDDIYENDAPDINIQNYPATNTIEGGTPGRPGIDYPQLSTIPQTDFNCKQQRYKGFFADINTNCQVWHYCDLNGGQASFLCPNGTIFNQIALTCDWWYNVKCSSQTTQQYVLNERLYKYILPYSPKFPEDYSGPLVDKYLALKFQELEEKMKKERKGKPKKEDGDESDEHVEDKDDSDQLREIQAKKIKEEAEEEQKET